MTTITTNTQSFYSTMQNQNDQLFNDEQIQRFDADTIKNRYGNNWKHFASNVREITQPDGSIVKEYIIEDPSLLEEIKPPSSSPVISDEEHRSLKNKFAQIKAKFEQKNVSNVMATPSISSVNSTNSTTTTTRQNSRKQMDELYARHRRASNESIPINRIDNEKQSSIGYSNRSTDSHNNYRRSQSIGSERSKTSTFRRFDSADEADEEVRRIHRQGEELRRHNQELPHASSLTNIPQQPPNVQYEVLDEDGNPMAINGVQDLIKMSGVRAREVPQPDGTIIKEYVIDDPQLLSQFRSQQPQSSYIQQQQQQQPPSTMTSSYHQQRNINENAPPPPPRIPLRPPSLFRQGSSSMNDNLPYNIQQIHVLEPQRRYEYLTTTGQRIQFFITNSNQSITDPDIRELTNAINVRLIPTSNPIIQQQQQPSTQYNQPKQWYPSVDITPRQRLGSDTQPYPNNSNMAFQQIQPDLSHSSSNGVLNHGNYTSQNQQQVFNESVNNWNKYRPQNNESFQSSAQFLPQQQTSTSYQQSMNYPYQGQQQHGVQILNDFNQQQTAIMADGHTRI